MTITNALMVIALAFQGVCIVMISIDWLRKSKPQAQFTRDELELIQHAIAERRGAIVRESIDKPSDTIDRIVADYRALAEKVALMLYN